MKQRELIHEYNKEYRPQFNRKFFERTDDDLINAIKYIVYSCERNAAFTIKINSFEVIENYDDVNHVLWEYEDSIINKGKTTDNSSSNKKNSKKKDNQFAFINLKSSALKVIKVEYFIEINEKKNGLVSDTVTVYIAIPRIIDGFYYKLNGNVYSAMYQIVDASTYNNSAAKNTKKQSITFKTIFMPIRVYRYSNNLTDINGIKIQATYFVANMFRKSLLLMKYLLAKFGIVECMNFLYIKDVYIVQDYSQFNNDNYYIFQAKDMYIVCSKQLYDSIQIMQSFIYSLYCIISYTKDISYNNIFEKKSWVKALGEEFTNKNIDTTFEKGCNILNSLEFIYDELTKEDLHLPDEDKADVYRVLRWMMYEFNALRQKDNLDISTKKVRYAEYLASYYAAKLAKGIYRISDKDDRADLDTIRKAIQIPPMYLINAITTCQLVNYKNCVNDLDSLIALKYTYKGISGIGEKSNAISGAYRSIHPSHLGRVDIDSSSNSDPGISGTICPLAQLYNGHFTQYQEPSSWRDDVSKVFDIYRAADSRKNMYRLLDDNNLSKQKNNTDSLNEALSTAKNMAEMVNFAIQNEEYIDGFDIHGDGKFFWLRE